MKRFFAKLIVFVLILWGVSYLISRVLDSKFRQDRSTKEAWTLSQHNRSFSYAVAGSSRAFNHIDVGTLQERTGRSAINIAYGGQNIIDVYVTLHLFLAHENQIGTVLLQLDGSDLNNSREFMTRLYVPYANDSEVARVEREVLGWKRYLVMKVCPLAKYWEYNNIYSWAELQNARSGVSKYDDTGGSELLFDESYHDFPTNPGDPELVLDTRSCEYLDRIVDLARSRGIKLLFFTAPAYHPNTFKKYDEATRTYITRYCETRGIPYLDFSKASFSQSEFRDHSHLNGRGALRFTAMLADSINQRTSTLLSERSR
jgi:hypothetical protein